MRERNREKGRERQKEINREKEIERQKERERNKVEIYTYLFVTSNKQIRLGRFRHKMSQKRPYIRR